MHCKDLIIIIMYYEWNYYYDDEYDYYHHLSTIIVNINLPFLLQRSAFCPLRSIPFCSSSCHHFISIKPASNALAKGFRRWTLRTSQWTLSTGRTTVKHSQTRKACGVDNFPHGGPGENPSGPKSYPPWTRGNPNRKGSEPSNHPGYLGRFDVRNSGSVYLEVERLR